MTHRYVKVFTVVHADFIERTVNKFLDGTADELVGVEVASAGTYPTIVVTLALTMERRSS